MISAFFISFFEPMCQVCHKYQTIFPYRMFQYLPLLSLAYIRLLLTYRNSRCESTHHFRRLCMTPFLPFVKVYRSMLFYSIGSASNKLAGKHPSQLTILYVLHHQYEYSLQVCSIIIKLKLSFLCLLKISGYYYCYFSLSACSMLCLVAPEMFHQFSPRVGCTYYKTSCLKLLACLFPINQVYPL